MSSSKSRAEKESMEAIRSLLFGEQIKSITDQLETLQASMEADLGTLESKLTEQISALQGYVDGEFQSISERFDREEDTRKKSISSTRDKMESLHKESGERVRKLQKRLTASEETAKKALSERSASLKKLVRETKQRLDDSIATEVSALNESAAHRSEVGKLLVDLGKGIQGEPS